MLITIVIVLLSALTLYDVNDRKSRRRPRSHGMQLTGEIRDGRQDNKSVA